MTLMKTWKLVDRVYVHSLVVHGHDLMTWVVVVVRMHVATLARGILNMYLPDEFNYTVDFF